MMDFLTDQQKAGLHQELLILQRTIAEQLGLSKPEKVVTLDQQLFGRVSRIDAIQQQQMASAGHQALQVKLKRVESALKRIESGDYGYCMDCDEPIPFERLQISPEVSICVSCQQERE